MTEPSEMAGASEAAAPGETPAGETAGASSARPETRRRKETKDKLLAAALEVFTARGIANASIEQISEAAGYTRGAFYSNFSSKEDLLIELLEYRQDSAIWEAEAALGTAIAENRPTSMKALHSVVIDAFVHMPECGRSWLLLRHELQLSALRDPVMARRLMESEATMHERVAELLDQTLAKVQRRSLISTNDLARLIVALFESSEQERLIDHPDAPPASGLFSRVLSAVLLQLTETSS